jgi:16S rRNA (guanine(1405)-N(7))-methyltransferase
VSADDVAGAVVESRRYRRVAPDLVRRIAAEEMAKAGRPAEAVKATKRRLHQILGAFGPEPPYPELLARLRAAYSSGDRGQVEAACRAALAGHASTRERLPVVETFYRRVFERTGVPRRLLDLGAGLGPLALPWMGLAADAEYRAYEADVAAVGFVNEHFRLAGRPPLAEPRDVVASPPAEPGDVALLLKLLPTVEQQGGSALALLDSVAARFLVVSYPVRSLGGRSKGMPRAYEARFRELAAERPWRVERLDLGVELVFVVERGRVE